MRLRLYSFLILEHIRSLRYMTNVPFLKASFRLWLFYLFCNPYRYCRKFLEQKGAKEVYAYGETPLSTMEKIAGKAKLSPSDVVIELGSGRGKTSLWLAAFTGSKVIGVEWIERFVDKANQAASHLPNARFIHTDVLNAPFEQASFVYLYASSWSDELIESLQERMQKLPKDAKIVSISFPLPDYPILEEFSVSFPWGTTSAYLQQK